MKITLVFVYGSLKRGFPLNGALRTAEFIGTVPLQGYTLHSAGAFPYMVPCALGTVLGEVYRVDDETLSRLDRIEQEGTLYKREAIGVYEGEEVYSYLAKSVQDTGFSEWKNQPQEDDFQEDLLYLAMSLLEDGIDYNDWLLLQGMLDTDELDNYIRECEGKAYLSNDFYSS